jgi:hypothetical protein
MGFAILLTSPFNIPGGIEFAEEIQGGAVMAHKARRRPNWKFHKKLAAPPREVPPARVPQKGANKPARRSTQADAAQT